MAANSTFQGRIWPNLESIQEFMVSVAYNNEADPINNIGARVVTTLFIDFFRGSMAANSEVREEILTKFKLIKAFMVGLVTCKNEEDPF